MRELQLLADYLVRLRQDKLQYAHMLALADQPRVANIQACAHEAELCDRIRAAISVLDTDPGKFIQEYLPQRQQ